MKRLLVVDDEDHTRMMLRRFFVKHWCLDVTIVASGEEAIAVLSRERFDGILTDYRMGGLSGIDVLAYARAEQPDAVRVLMSGFADPGIVQGAKARAAIHTFIEKPLRSAQFEEELRRAMLDPYGFSCA